MMEALHDFARTILQEAIISSENILQEARDKKESTIERRRQEGIKKANEDAKAILGKAHSTAETTTISKIANAKNKANWVGLSKKEKWINTVLKEVKNRLEEIRQTKKYPAIIEQFILEAGILLEGGELVIVLSDRDVDVPLTLSKLAQKISKETGKPTKLRIVKEKAEISGGVKVRNSDGKITVDNTFDDILKRKDRDLRKKIAEVLFR